MYYIGIKFSTECEMQVRGGKKKCKISSTEVSSLHCVKKPTITHLRNGFTLETKRNLLEAPDDHPIFEVENEWKKRAIVSRHTCKPNLPLLVSTFTSFLQSPPHGHTWQDQRVSYYCKNLRAWNIDDSWEMACDFHYVTSQDWAMH